MLQNACNPKGTHFCQQPLTIRTGWNGHGTPHRDAGFNGPRCAKWGGRGEGDARGRWNRLKGSGDLCIVLLGKQVLVAGTSQGLCKGLDTHEALTRVFGKRAQDHSLHIGGKLRAPLSQWLRWLLQVLLNKLPRSSFKGSLAAEPFIDHNAECILVTGKAHFASQLLWS